MVTVPRTITVQLEKHLKHALPDPNSYEGDEFLIPFRYQFKSGNDEQVRTAKFVKERMGISNKFMWVYEGIMQ